MLWRRLIIDNIIQQPGDTAHGREQTPEASGSGALISEQGIDGEITNESGGAGEESYAVVKVEYVKVENVKVEDVKEEIGSEVVLSSKREVSESDLRSDARGEGSGFEVDRE